MSLIALASGLGLDHEVSIAAVGCLLITCLLLWYRWFDARHRPSPPTAEACLAGGPNFCMPELVPDFSFRSSPQLQVLVSWLDELCTLPSGSVKDVLLREPQDFDHVAAQAEIEALSDHERACAKVVTGWLVQRIRSETPTYPPALLATDLLLGKMMGCGVGGCSNMSFIYNWEHPAYKPGKVYDARSLVSHAPDPNDTGKKKSNRGLRCRFVPLGGDAASSFEAFIMAHIVMEAEACSLFSEAATVIGRLRRKPNDIVFPTVLPELESIRASTKCMGDAFSSYLQPLHLALEHWPDIQRTLQLPEYHGMGGAQNTSITLIGDIVGVEQPVHPANQALDVVADAHFLPHQRRVVTFFRDSRDIIRKYILSRSASKNEVCAYNKIVDALLRWRGIHRARTVSYVGHAASCPALRGDGPTMTSTDSCTSGTCVYTTSTGTALGSVKSMTEQFDSRMTEYARLKVVAVEEGSHAQCTPDLDSLPRILGKKRGFSLIESSTLTYVVRPFNRSTKK